jgi:hypothetical protein
MPRRDYTERQRTLGEVGLHPRAMLQVKEAD